MYLQKVADSGSRLEVDILPARDLSAAHLTRWRRIARAVPDLGSPFFHPAYIQLLGAHRTNLEVAVVSDGVTSLGFLPFERHRGHVARPPGLRLCDFQGIVTDTVLPWSPDEFLDAAGLDVWHFDHWLATQAFARDHASTVDASPQIDLRLGFAHYVTERRHAGTRIITEMQRKLRKLEREQGAVEFRWHDPDPEAFAYLLHWKRRQRAQTDTVDVLHWDWVREFTKSLCGVHRNGFSGMLSTLRVGGQLAAVHLGLSTRRVAHWWMPTYNPDLARYSPGAILLMRVLEESAARDIKWVDLGKGDERYKSSFANGSMELARGTVDRWPMRGTIRRRCAELARRLTNSPLGLTCRRPARWVRGRLATQQMEIGA